MRASFDLPAADGRNEDFASTGVEIGGQDRLRFELRIAERASGSVASGTPARCPMRVIRPYQTLYAIAWP